MDVPVWNRHGDEHPGARGERRRVRGEDAGWKPSVLPDRQRGGLVRPSPARPEDVECTDLPGRVAGACAGGGCAGSGSEVRHSRRGREHRVAYADRRLVGLDHGSAAGYAADASLLFRWAGDESGSEYSEPDEARDDAARAAYVRHIE